MLECIESNTSDKMTQCSVIRRLLNLTGKFSAVPQQTSLLSDIPTKGIYTLPNVAVLFLYLSGKKTSQAVDFNF